MSPSQRATRGDEAPLPPRQAVPAVRFVQRRQRFVHLPVFGAQPGKAAARLSLFAEHQPPTPQAFPFSRIHHQLLLAHWSRRKPGVIR